MNKKNLFSIFVLIPFMLSAQFSKVPKQYSFEAGYRNLFSVINDDNKAMNGYGFLFDYAWQLSGLDGSKPKVFLSVPMGYSIMMPVDNLSRRISMLNYGWTVRHELKKKSDFMPFVGYGLFLNNLKYKDVPGSVNGHQTQFEFGYNISSKSRLQYFAKIQYSYTSYPKIGIKERMHYQFADIRFGIRF